ncbi:PAS-domain containing protein [Maritimibacter sp. DP1N21-5]|uniref:hybrid sensor histidine kinase/response regulator n=1 Tax=Maritimibacter sp. DP1N21-5 TaxID=2836867 RepID=UPI001C451079|nr:PAS-domain containing protein [Maritimibacter sp. DP1N21-5]MBV7407882.1 PAS-domain containing protein [Maritimibacter sp. DP1N21-5]
MDLKYTDIAALTQAGLNLIGQAMSIYDANLRFVVGNRAFQTMFDLPDHLVTRGARFEDTIRWLAERGEYGPVDDVDDFVEVRVTQAQAFEQHYMERTRSNGHWVSVEGNPLPQGGWVTVYTDITGIKRQESLLRTRSEELSDQVLARAEELETANRALAATNTALIELQRQLTEMEARTRMTTEMMPAHIARVDRDLRYTYSNRRLSSVLPGTPRQIIGLSSRKALGEEAFGQIEPYLAQALDGAPSVFEFDHEGTGRRIRVAFTPDDAGGEITGVYILSMDVTEEARARAALTQTRKRELAAQLTSGLAHDFSNLLTIILGMQSRLGELDLPPDAREIIAATTGAARRGGRILERIASMSGEPELRPEAVTLPTLLAEAETLARAALPERIDLTVVNEARAGAVMLDVGAVQDALLNLVLNARDAIASEHQTGGQIGITVRQVADTWLDFVVTDTGPGFTPEALDHAFDAFFTTKGGDGSGLGLAMVYDHAKLNGGRVRVENTEAGAQVTMRLPLIPAGQDAGPTMVLLVEDNPDIRADVRDMLVGLGHTVIEAENAAEALGLAEIDGIGLVLSDIMLGEGMTGDVLIEALDRAGLRCPRLLMSSLPKSDPKRAGLKVLSKPFSRGQLAAFIGEASL